MDERIGAGPATSPRAALALASATLALLSILVLPLVLGLDEQVYRWLQFHRPCAARALAWWTDTSVRTTLGAVLLGAFLAQERRRLALLVEPTLVVLTGAALGEVLKTAVERLRPSALPWMISGNSLPSGHVMNTTMVAVVACLLVRASRLPRAARAATYAVAVACVVAQASARVLRGSHWVSDVPASVLLGAAWALGAGLAWRRARAGAVAGLLAMPLAFLVFQQLPALRLRVPSALDAAPGTASSWIGAVVPFAHAAAPGTPTAPGAARAALPAEILAADAVTSVVHDGREPAVVKLILRATCDRIPPGCTRVAVSVNDWTAPPLTLGCGWREYHLAPPPGTLRPGANDVRLARVDADERPCAAPAEVHRVPPWAGARQAPEAWRARGAAAATPRR